MENHQHFGLEPHFYCKLKFHSALRYQTMYTNGPTLTLEGCFKTVKCQKFNYESKISLMLYKKFCNYHACRRPANQEQLASLEYRAGEIQIAV